MPSYYEILGVSKDANDSEIKKAYRSASLKYHPDRNQSKEAITNLATSSEAAIMTTANAAPANNLLNPLTE